MACCCELQNTLDVEVTHDTLDVEIGGSAGVLLQAKSVEVTANGTSVVAPDDGFDGLQLVEINTNTPKNITGVIGVPDGMSIAQLLCSSAASSVTEIVDTNVGWTLDKAHSLERLIALFPALTEIIYGCKYITKSLTDTRYAYKLPEKLSFNGLEECVSVPLIAMCEGAFTGNKEMSFPALKKMGCLFCYQGNGWWASSISTDTLRFDALEEITSAGGGRGAFIEVQCPNLKKLDLSSVKSMGRPLYGGSCLQGLEELDLSGTSNVNLCHRTYPANISTVLLLLKIKEGFAVNLNLKYWSPTLDSSNLQQFLQNFKAYIAERLTDKGTGLTLTLSQEVRNAIHAAEDEYGIENIIITQKGWTISPAPN